MGNLEVREPSNLSINNQRVEVRRKTLCRFRNVARYWLLLRFHDGDLPPEAMVLFTVLFTLTAKYFWAVDFGLGRMRTSSPVGVHPGPFCNHSSEGGGKGGRCLIMRIICLVYTM